MTMATNNQSRGVRVYDAIGIAPDVLEGDAYTDLYGQQTSGLALMGVSRYVRGFGNEMVMRRHAPNVGFIALQYPREVPPIDTSSLARDPEEAGLPPANYIG
jgi:hypothetical protein